jgi:hypothetical protein
MLSVALSLALCIIAGVSLLVFGIVVFAYALNAACGQRPLFFEYSREFESEEGSVCTYVVLGCMLMMLVGLKRGVEIDR